VLGAAARRLLLLMSLTVVVRQPFGMSPSSDSWNASGNRLAMALGGRDIAAFGLGADGIEVHKP